MGRPTDYTPELGDLICAELVTPRSLSSVCRDEGMPNKRTVLRWLRIHEEFQKLYSIAVLERADSVFEDMFEIADDARNDFMEETNADGKPSGVYRFRKEHVQRSRLRIETRKWALARMNPKKYGDKMTAELTGSEGGPIKVELVRFGELVDVVKNGSGNGGHGTPTA